MFLILYVLAPGLAIWFLVACVIGGLLTPIRRPPGKRRQ
jgi:hypothetical protein